MQSRRFRYIKRTITFLDGIGQVLDIYGHIGRESRAYYYIKRDWNQAEDRLVIAKDVETVYGDMGTILSKVTKHKTANDPAVV